MDEFNWPQTFIPAIQDIQNNYGSDVMLVCGREGDGWHVALCTEDFTEIYGAKGYTLEGALDNLDGEIKKG